MDIEEVLISLKIPFADSSHHHVRSGWIGIDCPRCSPGWQKFRLGINRANGKSSCWTCGVSNAPKMMALSSGKSFSSVLSLWQQIRFNYRTHKKEAIDRHLELPKGIEEMQEAHRAYLRDRKFDPDAIANLWGVKGIGIAVRLAWRLFIPIHDAEGIMVAWTTRSLNPSADLRYITSKEEQSEVDVKSLLYGEHLAQDSVIVNEGPIDAWAWGYGGVSTLGVAYTEIQVARLARYPLRCVCFDSTADAQRRAEQLCQQLAAFPGETHNVLLESGKDSASADFEEITEIKQFVGLI